MKDVLQLIWIIFATAWLVMFAKNEEKSEKYEWLSIAGMFVANAIIHFL